MGLDNNDLLLSHKYQKGKLNLITDVANVLVGHVTLKDHVKKINTGVTAILPHRGNLFQEKVMAGVSVINGFGKSVGLMQIDELGTIETPIIMTNTLSVGTALTALVKYMLEQNEDIGRSTGTVNCIVTECNDSRLNDIRGLHVKEEDVLNAILNADTIFEEGDVGSGTGMCCLGFKGGIGSASRIIPIDGKDYTVGAIVMSNFGSCGNLVIDGEHIGKTIKDIKENEELKKDEGSIIIVIATDIPLSERQLKRVAKRSTIALGRVGSYLGNGSGDIALAFTTANNQKHYCDKSIIDVKMFYDEKIDCVFEASVEAVEESIISSLIHAKTMTSGFKIESINSLTDYL